MVDIFISYAREDSAQARRLSQALERLGYTCWWDQHLRSGARFLEETESQLHAARTVVVIWSKDSVRSHWVADEAAVGRDENRLAAISFDGSIPPLGFRQFQVTDLSGWKGGSEEPTFHSLRGTLEQLCPAGAGRTPTALPVRGPVLSRRGILAAGAAGLAATAGATAWIALAPSLNSGARVRSVAVLPFRDNSPGGGQAFLADGLAESLLDRLAMNRSLLVPARTSSFAFRDTGATIAAIARELKVETVLEGSVAREGNRIRVRAALSDAASGLQIWSQSYERDLSGLDGVFELQDEITGEIIAALRTQLNLRSQRSSPRPANPQAWEAFLEGNALMAFRESNRARQAESAYERAIKADPGFGPAHARLTMALLFDPNDERPTTRSRALDEIRQAYAIDPGMPEAVIAEASSLFTFIPGRSASEISRAMERLKQLVSDDPMNVEAQSAVSLILSLEGRPAKADKAMRVLQELDPVGIDSTYASASVLQKSGQPLRALPLIKRAIELHPRAARLMERRSYIYLYAGDYAGLAHSAIEALETAPGDIENGRLAANMMAWAGCGDEALAVAVDAFTQVMAGSSLSDRARPPFSPAFFTNLPTLIQRASYITCVSTDPGQRRAAWEAVEREQPNAAVIFLGPRGYLPYLPDGLRQTGDAAGAEVRLRKVRAAHQEMAADGWGGFELDYQSFMLAACLGDRPDMYRRWDALVQAGCWYVIMPNRPIFDQFRGEPEFEKRSRRREEDSAKARAFLQSEGLLARAREVITANGWTPELKQLPSAGEAAIPG